MSELNFNDFFKEITKRIDGKKSTDDIFVNVERNLGNDVWDTGLEANFHTGLWFSDTNKIKTKNYSNYYRRFLTFFFVIILFILGGVCFYNSNKQEVSKSKPPIHVEREIDKYESPSIY